ncbi:hypothetical protein K488DRAFT_83215 [Vararia minispora EC-137]|uniref:Uncharacterized protein n=1 Tax=Vararia minispora EC-137 TaxID=1314806 RepID=A0ACB8QUC6_9AGAM|nr:hypothetical protein K488DRAFT_83215 [Vararia minispora EC-137]
MSHHVPSPALPHRALSSAGSYRVPTSRRSPAQMPAPLSPYMPSPALLRSLRSYNFPPPSPAASGTFLPAAPSPSSPRSRRARSLAQKLQDLIPILEPEDAPRLPPQSMRALEQAVDRALNELGNRSATEADLEDVERAIDVVLNGAEVELARRASAGEKTVRFAEPAHVQAPVRRASIVPPSPKRKEGERWVVVEAPPTRLGVIEPRPARHISQGEPTGTRTRRASSASATYPYPVPTSPRIPLQDVQNNSVAPRDREKTPQREKRDESAARGRSASKHRRTKSEAVVPVQGPMIPFHPARKVSGQYHSARPAYEGLASFERFYLPFPAEPQTQH